MDKNRQRELKLAYRLSRPPMGIYAIRNSANGKLYLDRSTNLTGSLNRHRLELKLGTHRNPAMMQDWRQYGEAQFAFEILEQLKDSPEPDFNYAAELDRRLAHWREKHPSGSPDSYC